MFWIQGLRAVTGAMALVLPQATLQGGHLLAPPRLEWRFLKPANTGIPGDQNQVVFVDAEDRPWISGYIPFWEEGGMARFDGDRWFSVTNVDYPEIASPRFNDIEADAAGVFWIATDFGLLRYDPLVGPDSLQRFDQTNTPLHASQLVDVDVDPTGAVWMAIADAAGPGGLARFQPATGAWNVWTTANGLPWGGQWPGWDQVDHVVVLPDPPGPGAGFTVWFTSPQFGMAVLRNGDFRWFAANPPASGPVPLTFYGKRQRDGDGNLWLLTDRGLARRNPDGTYLLTGFPPFVPSGPLVLAAFAGGRAAMGMANADVWLYEGGWTYRGNWGGGTWTYSLAEDSTGAIWAAGRTGAAKLEGGAWQRYRLTNTGMLGYFIETLDFDRAGNLYVNGNAGPGVGGFSIFDGTRWTCVNDYNYGLGPAWGQLSDDVEVLCARADGTLALEPGGIQGVLSWDGATYTSLEPTYIANELEEDTLGRLWVGNSGRVILVDAQQQITVFDDTNSPLLGFATASIVADRVNPGFVWITTGLGVMHTDGVTWQVYPRELVGLTLFSLGYFFTGAAPSSDGTLWIGSGRGLYELDPVSLRYRQHTKVNSALPSNEIDHLVVAPDDTVWVSTFDSNYPYPGGITHFDGSGSTTYSAGSSPLPHNQIADLACRAVGDGYELWIGTASEGIAVLSVTPTPIRLAPGAR